MHSISVRVSAAELEWCRRGGPEISVSSQVRLDLSRLRRLFELASDHPQMTLREALAILAAGK